MGYRSLYWCCPFYTFDEKQTVHCEGGSRIVFPSVEQALDYYRQRCVDLNGWRECPIAAILLQHYEEEENEQ